MSIFDDDDTEIDLWQPSVDDSRIRPPTFLIALCVVELIALAGLLVPSSKPLHWIGYAIGAVLVPSTVSTFRSVDRTRQRSSSYSSPGWVRSVPTYLLIAGVSLAVAHAYFLALNTKLA